MNNHLVWEERFNIGVDIIDKEHKRLFKIINKLFDFSDDEEKKQWVCQEGIKYFKEHAIQHFADEEEYMKSINYGGLEIHKRIHDDFREQTIPVIEKELDQTNYSDDAINHFLGVCTGWLLGHTLTEDQAITRKTSSKWDNLLQNEQHDLIRDTIIQLVYDMFRLDTQVVSESYGGEKFGKGIYYRLINSNENGKKFETIMVFEEKLLINTVGKMMGIKTNKVNVMLLNAVGYTVKQFTNRVMEQFPSTKEFDKKSENLLTYEQFKKVFTRDKPQFSLLFDTGEGYFAYCIIAPHLSEQELEVTLKSVNEIEEIEKFLQKNEKNQLEISKKKKILVVDDSELILEFMNGLLGKDYEVLNASSGLSAIRSLTLNRPDLILLDYEMPVCDGKQVLEMIRSEKDFADISVIFLTGRVDEDSIRKVLSLKPAGYLSKSLKPAEIKENIDEYFRKVDKK